MKKDVKYPIVECIVLSKVIIIRTWTNISEYSDKLINVDKVSISIST